MVEQRCLNENWLDHFVKCQLQSPDIETVPAQSLGYPLRVKESSFTGLRTNVFDKSSLTYQSGRNRTVNLSGKEKLKGSTVMWYERGCSNKDSGPRRVSLVLYLGKNSRRTKKNVGLSKNSLLNLKIKIKTKSCSDQILLSRLVFFLVLLKRKKRRKKKD